MIYTLCVVIYACLRDKASLRFEKNKDTPFGVSLFSGAADET